MSELALTNPDALMEHPDVKEFSKSITDLEAKVLDLEVTDDKSLAAAAAVIGEISMINKKAESTRKAIVGPFKKHLANLDKMFRENFRKPCEKLRAYVEDDLIRPYRREQERIQEEERRKVEAELAKKQAAAEAAAKAKQKELDAMAAELGASEVPTVEPEIIMPEVIVPAQAKTIQTGSSALRTKKVWKFKVVNKTAVPAEYLLDDPTDHKAVNWAIKDGVRTIPGLDIYEEESYVSVGVK